MTAPRTGPHIRSQAIGGPAWRIVRGPSPGTTSTAGRTPTSIGRADVIRSTANAFAARTRAPTGSSASSSRRASSSPSSRSPSAGGRQSSWTTAAPWARGASAELGDADVDDAGLGAQERHQAGPPVAVATPAGRLPLVGPSRRRADDRAPPAGPPGRCSARAGRRPRAASTPAVQPLRIGLGAADRGRRSSSAPAGLGGDADGPLDGRRDGAGRIGMAAVAEHDVEQDHGGRSGLRRPRRRARCGAGSRSSGAAGRPCTRRRRGRSPRSRRRRAARRGSARPRSRASRRCRGRAPSAGRAAGAHGPPRPAASSAVVGRSRSRPGRHPPPRDGHGQPRGVFEGRGRDRRRPRGQRPDRRPGS